MAFGKHIRREGLDEKDFEFFGDEFLKEAGVNNAITRVRMRRRISEHFQAQAMLIPSPPAPSLVLRV
jgi:hypothetical protein